MFPDKFEELRNTLTSIMADKIQDLVDVLSIIEDDNESKELENSIRVLINKLYEIENEYLLDSTEVNARKNLVQFYKKTTAAIKKFENECKDIEEKYQGGLDSKYTIKNIINQISIAANYIKQLFSRSDDRFFRCKNSSFIQSIENIHDSLVIEIGKNQNTFGFTLASFQEWGFAKQHLIVHGTMSPNGTKLRRKDFNGKLSHSFIVIDGKILAIQANNKSYVGMGQCGHVKLATDEEGNLYALKIIQNYSQESKIVYAQNESEITKATNASSLTYATREDKVYIAYNFCFGKTLAQFIHEKFPNIKLNTLGMMSKNERITLVSSILEALKTLHDKGYVHKDLNASNIMIDGNTAYLIDFERSSKSETARARTNDLIDLKKYVLNFLMCPLIQRNEELKKLMDNQTISDVGVFIDKLKEVCPLDIDQSLNVSPR